MSLEEKVLLVSLMLSLIIGLILAFCPSLLSMYDKLLMML